MRLQQQIGKSLILRKTLLPTRRDETGSHCTQTGLSGSHHARKPIQDRYRGSREDTGAKHTWRWALMVGPHLAIQKQSQHQTAAGKLSFQQGPVQHETLEDDDKTFQPSALAVPCSSLSCTHQDSEEPPSWVPGAEGHSGERTHSRNEERAKSMSYAQDLWGLAGAAWTHRFTHSAKSL